MSTKLPSIKWIKDADDSFYKSADGRFEISPLYLGRERPQGWELRDNETGDVSRNYSPLRHVKEKAQWALVPAPVEQLYKFAIQFEGDNAPRVIEAKSVGHYIKQLGYKLITVCPTGGVVQAPNDGVIHNGEEIKFSLCLK